MPDRKRRLTAHAAVVPDFAWRQSTALVIVVPVVIGLSATIASTTVWPYADRGLTALTAIVVDLFATKLTLRAVVIAWRAATSAVGSNAYRRLRAHAAVILKFACVVLSIGLGCDAATSSNGNC